MVTLIKYGALSGGEKYNVNQMWIDGLSTEQGGKPTTTIDGMGIPNGSVYTEIDTGKTYMFDAANATWHEVSIGGGGGGGIKLVGETTTDLTDGATTNPITIDGQSYTAKPNDAVIYGNKEFLFDGTHWHEFGDMSGLGSAAYKDVPTSGNASTTQVVMGDDSRLTDSRTPTDHASNKVTEMTGYTQDSPTQTNSILTSDTLNAAIRKLETGVETNQTNISSLQQTIGDINSVLEEVL